MLTDLLRQDMEQEAYAEQIEAELRQQERSLARRM
jgi:hypothetical protein